MLFDVYVTLKNGWGYIFHIDVPSKEEAEQQVIAYVLKKHGDKAESVRVEPMAVTTEAETP